MPKPSTTDQEFIAVFDAVGGTKASLILGVTERNVEDGEWVTISWKKQREMCCGCGKEHDVDYRVEDGKLQFRAIQRRSRRAFKFEKD